MHGKQWSLPTWKPLLCISPPAIYFLSTVPPSAIQPLCHSPLHGALVHAAWFNVRPLQVCKLIGWRSLIRPWLSDLRRLMWPAPGWGGWGECYPFPSTLSNLVCDAVTSGYFLLISGWDHLALGFMVVAVTNC